MVLTLPPSDPKSHTLGTRQGTSTNDSNNPINLDRHGPTMKCARFLLLNAATVASTSIPPLAEFLPPTRFDAKLFFGPALLPVNPTLANIIDTMGNVARCGFREQVQPRTYSSPPYPQVQVTIHTPTEARFLLWGFYNAATEMIRFSRFNGVTVELYWNSNLVGKISLGLRADSDLSGAAILNSSRDATDTGGLLSLASKSNGTAPDFVRRRNDPPIQKVEVANSADNISMIDSLNQSITPTNASLSSSFSIDFDPVPGAAKLKRNDVFLGFFAAMLRVAKYPAEDTMDYFTCAPPNVNLRVRMYEVGNGCLVKQFFLLPRDNSTFYRPVRCMYIS